MHARTKDRRQPRNCSTGEWKGPRRWREDARVKLMLRVQQGDEEAFQKLLGHYSPRVFGYLCRVVRDRNEAEDLTQEVFLRIYRSRERYEPLASFDTWVFHITQNVARNALRTRRRRMCIPMDLRQVEEKGLGEVRQPAAGVSPGMPLERDEIKGVVRSAVATLAGRQRRAVELHQLEGRTYEEVARKMEMTPKAAKSLLYRARSELRRVLTPFMS